MLICMKSAHCTKLDGHSGACGKTAMTAPDVRTAAQEEAEARALGDRLPRLGYEVEEAFTEGAVWGAALVTPTREALVSKLYDAMCDFPTREIDPSRSWTLQEAEEYADAVLALMEHG